MVRKGKKLEFISLHGNTLRHDDDCGCRMLARLLPAAHLYTWGRVESRSRSLSTEPWPNLFQSWSQRVAICSRSSRSRSREAMNCACTSLNAPCRVSARVVSCPERRRVSMTSRCLWRHVSDAATRSSARARSSGRSRFIRILLYLWATNYHDPLAARRTNQPSLAAVCVPRRSGAAGVLDGSRVEAAPQGGGWSKFGDEAAGRPSAGQIPFLSVGSFPRIDRLADGPG